MANIAPVGEKSMWNFWQILAQCSAEIEPLPFSLNVNSETSETKGCYVNLINSDQVHKTQTICTTFRVISWFIWTPVGPFPDWRCLPGYNLTNLSEHIWPWSSTSVGAPGTFCLSSWQILQPNFLVQGSQVSMQSERCMISSFVLAPSTIWTQRLLLEKLTVAIQRLLPVIRTSRGSRQWFV